MNHHAATPANGYSLRLSPGWWVILINAKTDTDRAKETAPARGELRSWLKSGVVSLRGDGRVPLTLPERHFDATTNLLAPSGTPFPDGFFR
jgi:hypothetical protein